MRQILYGIVYALLIVFTFVELMLIGLAMPIALLYVSLISMAGVKAILIALFFQHLAYEPKALSGLALLGFTAAVIFMAISLFSMAGIRVGL